ncbi:MAG: transporter substrate-binding domain-containing protein [Acetobacteraceae bacterium]|nr:transporter substrate-binding domain-containing protein [Acetobacteraceae bacterium]
MSEIVCAELAPHGTLRAGINLSNFLLVSGKSRSGEPEGVAPSLARAIADRLGVPVHYVTFPRPGDLADAVNTNAWDIGLIGAEPQRAEKITFTAAYAEIEATYLVPPGSTLSTIAEIDQPGLRIAVAARSAYGLWSERNIRHAELVQSNSLDASFEQFVRDELDALAGLRPRLLADVQKFPGARILEGKFMSVQQAVGTASANKVGAAFLRNFIEEAKSSGLIARLIDQFGMTGRLTVAPAAYASPLPVAGQVAARSTTDEGTHDLLIPGRSGPPFTHRYSPCYLSWWRGPCSSERLSL